MAQLSQLVCLEINPVGQDEFIALTLSGEFPDTSLPDGADGVLRSVSTVALSPPPERDVPEGTFLTSVALSDKLSIVQPNRCIVYSLVVVQYLDRYAGRIAKPVGAIQFRQAFALLETLYHHNFRLTYYHSKVNELIDPVQILRSTYCQLLALEAVAQRAVGLRAPTPAPTH